MDGSDDRHDPRGNSEPDASAGSVGVRYLLGAIVIAKVATIAVVLWLNWGGEAGVWAAATFWHWLVVAAALLAGPILFHLRLRRVRARREALRRAEWMSDDVPPASSDRPRNRPAGAH